MIPGVSAKPNNIARRSVGGSGQCSGFLLFVREWFVELLFVEASANAEASEHTVAGGQRGPTKWWKHHHR